MRMSKRLTSALLSVSLLSAGMVLPTANAVVTDKNSSEGTVDANASSATIYKVSDQQKGSILQCFNWSYDTIRSKMAKISEQGFTAIQTSPIQTAKEGTTGKTAKGSWWVQYQPADFTIEKNQNGTSALGTVTEFKAMCDEAHKYGVRVIVDAVLNHMANQSRNDLSTKIPQKYRNDSSFWHDISKNSWYSSRYDITHYCMDGIPDLNTASSAVQAAATSFLKECIDNGADGFRFDGAKHIETPADVSNVRSDFWPNVLNAVTSYAKSTKGITPYYYGEILGGTTGSDDKNMGVPVTNSYASYMSVTVSGVADNIRGYVNSKNGAGAQRSDFTLNDDGSKVAGSKAVLWNESHDTYQSGTSSSMSDRVMKQAWALVGTRAEACGMYMARPSNWSTAKMGQGDTTAWADPEVKAANDFHNYFVGQTEYLSSSGSIAYNERGTSGVVIVNCNGGSTSVSLTANKMKSGTYKDQVSGNTFTVSGGKINGSIGSTGVAVVYNNEKVPEPTISQSGGSFKTDTLSLTLGLKNATSGTYKIGSAAAKTYTSTTTITIGSDMNPGESVSIVLTAIDGKTNSGSKTYTFTKIDFNSIQRIYFDNSSYNWSSVYAYVYAGDAKNSAWPGKAMSKDSATGYYVYTVPEGLEDGRVIFTESSSATTHRYPADMQPGLELEGKTKLFKSGNKLVDYTPPVPTTTVKPTTTVPTTTVKPTTTVPTTTVKPTTTVPTTTVKPTTTVPTTTVKPTTTVPTTTVKPTTTVPTTTVKPTTTTVKPTTTTVKPTTQPTSSTAVVGKTYKYGDVNLDGSVDIRDATLIQKYTIRYVKFGALQLLAGDVTGDGMVNIKDATNIQKYAINIKTTARTGQTFVYNGENTNPSTTNPNEIKYATVNGTKYKVGDEITFTYSLTASLPIEDMQGQLSYSNSGLMLETFSSIIEDGVAYNTDNVLNSGSKNVLYSFAAGTKPYDCSAGRELFSARFEIVQEGNWTINFNIVHLDGQENGNQVPLVSNGIIETGAVFSAKSSIKAEEVVQPTTTTTKATTAPTTTKPVTTTTVPKTTVPQTTTVPKTTVTTARKLYANFSATHQGNERYAAYFFKGTSTNQWVNMTAVTSGKIYSVEIPSGYESAKVIFVRMNGSKSANTWDNRWNQSSDLSISTSSNLYKVTGWGSGNLFRGSWSGNY